MTFTVKGTGRCTYRIDLNMMTIKEMSDGYPDRLWHIKVVDNELCYKQVSNDLYKACDYLPPFIQKAYQEALDHEVEELLR
jgi:hypothetical protein